MEKKENRLRKRKRSIYIIIAVLMTILTMTGISRTFIAKAFPAYELDEDNNMTLVIRQKKALSSTTLKYETVEWYLHKEALGGAREKLTSFGADALPVEIAKRDRNEEGDYYYDTIMLKSDRLVEWALEHFTRQELIDGKTVFASRSLQTVNSSVSPAVTKGPFFCYEDIAAQADWSNGALRTFRSQTYDQSVFIKLKSTKVTIKVMNETTGDEISGYSFDTETYLFGETIRKTAPDITGYDYNGYEIKGSKDSVSGNSKSISKLLKSSELGNGDITLTFHYVAEESPDPDDDVPPTQAPVSPTPTPTPLPSPAPSMEEAYDKDYRYFTTDAGYTMHSIASTSGYTLAGWSSKTYSGYITSNAATKRASSYLVGTDADGNTWYFLADDTNAIYVHPAVYNGYSADDSNVKYITELTFPSTITCNGTSYTVTGIGGGSPTYHTPATTDGSGSQTNYEYGEASGWYEYVSENSAGTMMKYTGIEYLYGVVGNGYIISEGENIYETSNGYWKDYTNSYFVYNTTLKEITIPSTVTTIQEYAFYGCEALDTIHGGDGLINIGYDAFRSTANKTSVLSKTWNTSTDTGTSEGDVYYYYNDSYSTSAKTSVMTAWESAVAFKYTMVVPVFPKLQTLVGNTFAYHENLNEVTLADTVTSIGSGAFTGCKLDYIRILSKSVVTLPGFKDTLGTKGMVADKTIIYAEPDAAAVVEYGRKYDDYYTLKAGYKVIYHSNDGTLRTETATTELENLYADIVAATGDFSIEYDGTVWKDGTLICQSQAPDTGKDMISDTYSIVYHGTDGNVYHVYYYRNGSTITQKINALSLSYEVKEFTSISSSYNGNTTFYYTASDGNRYNCVVSADGTLTETLYSAAPTPTPTPAAMTLSYEFYYRGYDKAGKSSADSKLYYLDNYNGRWYTISSSYYPSASYTYSALWRGTNTPMGTYDEELASYMDADKAVYYALTTSGTFYFKCPDTGNTWYSISTGIKNEIVNVWQVWYGDGNDDADYSWSVIQDVNGTVYLVKAYIAAYSSTSATRYSAVYNIGTTDGLISETLRTMTDYEDYQLSDNRSYSNDIGSDGMLFVLTDTGAFYTISVPVTWSSYTPSMARMGSDTTYFKADNIYFENNGLNDPEYRSDGLWNSPCFYFGDLGIVALANDGSVWCTGVHDANAEPFGDAGYIPSESVPLSAYMSLTDISNGMTYTDIFPYGHILAIGTDKKLYAAGYYYAERTTVGNATYVTVKYDFHVVYDEAECRMFLRDYSSYDTYRYVITEKGHVSWEKTSYLPYISIYGNIYDKGYQFSGKILYNTFFIRNGYDFVTWNTSSAGNGTTYEPGTELVLTSELNLYAQWEASLPTIHYNANGGSGGMADTVLPLGTTSTYLAKNRFYRTDYRFAGWNTKEDGTGTSYADEAYVTGLTGYLELFAQWEEVVTTYTLVYMKYPYGSAENMVWKTKNMINSVSNTTTETIEGEPFASTGYTVSYDLNKTGSMSTTPVMGTLTSINTSTSAPTFQRWQLREPDADGIHQYYGDNYAPGDVVERLTNKDRATLYLYPTWGGSGSYVLLPSATCEGYTLLGWCEVSDGSAEIYYPNDEDSDEVSTYVPVKDTTLYAVWEAEKEEVAFDFKIIGTSDPAAEKLLKQGRQAMTIKRGHSFSYAFYIEESDTVANESVVSIIPSYFWISEDGTKRSKAFVYYHVVVNGNVQYFIKAGSEIDGRNGMQDGSILLTERQIQEEMICLEGTFVIPSEVYVLCEENLELFEEYRNSRVLTGREDFFEKTGYLVVAFSIEHQSDLNEKIPFETWEQTEVYQDAMAEGWNWMPGDVIRYDLARHSAEDYEVGAVE